MRIAWFVVSADCSLLVRWASTLSLPLSRAAARAASAGRTRERSRHHGLDGGRATADATS